MSAGVGANLVFVETIMDRYVYLNLLKANLKCSVTKTSLSSNWIIQQDNDRKYKARILKEWLFYNIPKQLYSSPQSPDINPIENLWDELDQRDRKNKISNKEYLKRALLEEWNEISADVTQNLVSSMPRRIQSILNAKGGPTKYNFFF